MNPLHAWADAVCAELDIADAVDRDALTRQVLDLARDVAHAVDRPAAPLTAYLLGVAAARADDPIAAVPELAERVRRLTTGWTPPE